MRLSAPLCLLAAIIAFSCCQKEIKFDSTSGIPGTPPSDSIPTTPPFSIERDQQVIAGFIGRVLDEKNEPVKDAQVAAGGKTVFTDEYGIFRINEVMVSAQSSFIMVKREGYLPGSRTLISQAGTSSFTQIKLIKKVLKASFNAAAGASIYVGSSTGVKFPPNAIATSTGEAYNGQVLVYGTMFDPVAEDFADIMPGSLRGITADSQATALRSYGMLSVLLETEAGDPLQIAKGKLASITIPVASKLLASAPAEIPLWHFSEVDGKWREEGKAALKDGKYYGEVSHFSTWNCDVPESFVFVRVKVVGQNGFAVPYSLVKIIDNETKGYVTGFTDSLGIGNMAAPKNKAFTIEVFSHCGIVLGTFQVGAVNADIDLGKFKISEDKLVTLTGTATFCDGQKLKNGVANLFNAGLYYGAAVRDGEFLMILNTCWAGVQQATISIVDQSSLSNSGLHQVELSGGATNVGNIEVCGNFAMQSLQFKFDSDSGFINIPTDNLTWYYSVAPSDPRLRTMYFSGTGENKSGFSITFNGDELSGIDSNALFNHKRSNYRAADYLNYEITQIGNVGEEMTLNFSGIVSLVKDSTEKHSLSGTAHVIRR